ncbi:MAG TPA: class I SAM-dependent methyltransferase [Candidatus Sabulitectum sp.]|nr:class I SAM-dependent methyltransferase [Candidatus Sabulitectum sp.]
MAGGMEILQEVLRGLPPGRAIDVASGQGGFAGAMAGRSEDADIVVAADLKPGFLTGTVPAAMDARMLAFRDGTFSVAGISNSLHHLPYPLEVLGEMARVLRSGGKIVVREMFRGGDQLPSQETHNLMHDWWGAVDRSMGVVHHPVYTLEELRTLLRSTVFQDWEFREFEVIGDPFHPDVIDRIESAWNTYMERAAGNEELMERGREVHRHFLSHGFSGARALVACAGKP